MEFVKYYWKNFHQNTICKQVKNGSILSAVWFLALMEALTV